MMDRNWSMIAVCITIIFFISSSESFYPVDVAPVDFRRGDPLEVKVNKLSSTKTQLPYDYYYLHYCNPDQIRNTIENIGATLHGDHIKKSMYMFHMQEQLPCTVVCRIRLDAKSAKDFKEMIDDEYRVNMILDNLPVAVLRQRYDGSQSTFYQHGFRVGFKGIYNNDEKYFINNHLSFRVMYHKNLDSNSARIVGFEVTPASINHEQKEWGEKNPQLTTCNKNTKYILQGSSVPQTVDRDTDVVFSYDVVFKESDLEWASRWDAYVLKLMNDDQLHWFSIVNSLIVVLFLSGMLAMIMMRILYKDISSYNQFDPLDESEEVTGWKVVHGDVFRAPANSGLLCVHVGTGVQIFGMTLTTLVFALLRSLSPSNRGSVIPATVLLWVLMGLFAGFSSGRLYKTLKGTEWKKIGLITSVMFPGILFAIFFVLNAFIWVAKSSGAIPFGTIFALVFLWLGISAPLVLVGSYLGFKKPVTVDPVKTNKIPRQVPKQPWYMKPVFSILLGGTLPFGVVFIELFFVLTSIWLNQFYNIVGFLFIAFVILVITCAEITIVLCYFQLRNEDYNWWWRAYLTSGSSALYVLLYSVFYFFAKLEITKFVSGLLYFGYMLIASYAFFVLTGTIGFYACLWFVRKIYSSLKID